VSEIAGRWLRVSTMAQDEAWQEPDVDRWIAQQGYAEGPTYRVHGASAFHGKHEPELRRVLDDMRAGRISVLVVWKSDRIDRHEKLGALLREAQGYGGRIEFVTEPELNMLAGLGGRVMTVVKEWSNAEESRSKSDRVKAKHAALRASQSWASGKAPYGCSRILKPCINCGASCCPGH
jgi:DNA invertase Pin-like site-specific DNA recombinase